MLKDTAPVKLVKPLSFFKHAARQARAYSNVVIWLLHTAFGGRSTRLIGAIALVALNLACQAAAIFTIYIYARAMEQGSAPTIPVLDMKLDIANVPQLLWIVVALAMFFFIASACFQFLSRRVALQIVEDHFAKSIEQVVLASRRLPDPRAPTASQMLVEYKVGGLTTGCRRGALIALSFANAISGTVGAIGAAAFLLYIDAPLTILILVAAGLGAVLLYPVAIRAVSLAKYREKVVSAFKEEAGRSPGPDEPEQPVSLSKAAADMARGFIGRRRVATEFIFAIEIGVTIIVGLVIYYMAHQAITGREEWAIFIAYVGALRLTLAGCSQAIRAFASVSRYYPQIVRYYLFMTDVPRLDTERLNTVSHGELVTLGSLPDGGDVVVRGGDRVLLATIEKAGPVRYALLNAHASDSSLPLGSAVFEPPAPLPDDASIILVNPEQLVSGGGTQLALDLSIPDRAAGESEDQKVPEGLLEDKVTLIVYQGDGEVGAVGEKYVLIVEDNALQRFLPFGTEESGAALDQFSRKAMRRRKKGLDVDDDEEDDDEE